MITSVWWNIREAAEVPFHWLFSGWPFEAFLNAFTDILRFVKDLKTWKFWRVFYESIVLLGVYGTKIQVSEIQKHMPEEDTKCAL